MLDSWNGFTVASGPNVGRCPSGNVGFMTLGASPEVPFGDISAGSDAAMILNGVKILMLCSQLETPIKWVVWDSERD